MSFHPPFITANGDRRRPTMTIWVMSYAMVFPFTAALLILTRAEASMQHCQRDKSCQLDNFIKHQRSVLNATALEIHNVSKPSVCAFHCVDQDGRCASYNVVSAPDRNGNYECQLLAVDRFSQPSGFRQSQEFTHYSKHVRLGYITNV